MSTPRHWFVSLVTLILIAAALPATALARQDQRIGWIVIDGPIVEQPSPLAWLFGADVEPTVRHMTAMIQDAAESDDIAALVIHLKDFQCGFSQVLALGAAMDDVRAANKRVHVFSENYGPMELLLGASADEVIMQTGGAVSFPGLYSEELYLADALGLVGLQADMVQVGDYKGAADQMARSSASPEWSQNIDALLDDLWAQMGERLREGRHLDDAQWQRVLDEGWSADAKQARSLGLIDTHLDILDLKDHVASQCGTDRVTLDLGPETDELQMDMTNPFAMMAMLMSEPDHTPTRPTVAVVHIDGPIVDGESTEGGLFGGASVGSRTVREALKRIEDEDLIKGVVVRIDSPGGSAIASEIIWQGLRRLAEHKPVFVSVGSMAASGGYYIAVGGDRIYVDPASIVGSIGVVGGKIVTGGLFEKINIGVTARARGPHAQLMSSTQPWDDSQRAMVRAEMKKIYDLFTSRVAAGRGNKVDLSKIAEGRLFTGRQAIGNGMADGIADFDQTIGMLAAKCGLSEGAYDVMTYPGPQSIPEMLESMLPGGVHSPRAQAASPLINVEAIRTLVGEGAWEQIRDSLNALMQLRERRVLLISPRAVVVK
ncbi:MAG: signal peptide peptidase SppA [Phycisphaerales bacterium]|nr:signal peptide peptidase SppA [Phycisphaerales bacterium]